MIFWRGEMLQILKFLLISVKTCHKNLFKNFTGFVKGQPKLYRKTADAQCSCIKVYAMYRKIFEYFSVKWLDLQVLRQYEIYFISFWLSIWKYFFRQILDWGYTLYLYIPLILYYQTGTTTSTTLFDFSNNTKVEKLWIEICYKRLLLIFLESTHQLICLISKTNFRNKFFEGSFVLGELS